MRFNMRPMTASWSRRISVSGCCFIRSSPESPRTAPIIVLTSCHVHKTFSTWKFARFGIYCRVCEGRLQVAHTIAAWDL